MKKTLLLIVPCILFAVAGCSKPADTEPGTPSAPEGGVGKGDTKTQGISADQVGVTDAGRNADQTTGSALGGK